MCSYKSLCSSTNLIFSSREKSSPAVALPASTASQGPSNLYRSPVLLNHFHYGLLLNSSLESNLTLSGHSVLSFWDNVPVTIIETIQFLFKILNLSQNSMSSQVWEGHFFLLSSVLFIIYVQIKCRNPISILVHYSFGAHLLCYF